MAAQIDLVHAYAETYRERLADLSWYMRVLNESVARLAQLPLSPLMAFDATGRLYSAIPFALEDYLELVEASGRVIRENKRGFIADQTPRLLERLHIDPEQFIVTATQMLQQFTTAIGTPEHIQQYCLNRQQAYLRGISSARGLYPQAA